MDVSTKYPRLPPIICDRDKIALKEVRTYIESELEKARCSTDDVDVKKFSIYSTAFSMLISKVTVYRDILSDIKREYEDCINALKNGEREAKFLKVKVKTMTSIPTTVHGYMKREKELRERLSILYAENERLEGILKKIIDEHQSLNHDHHDEVESDQEEESETDITELKPIPGMPVSEWIDEDALKYTLEKLTNALEDLKSQKQSSYVTIEEMRFAQQEFDGKYAEKEKLEEECQTLKGRQKILKMAADTAREYRELKHDIVDEKLSSYISKKVTAYSIKRETTNLVESPYSVFDDDDPSKEKEAEMILDYIEKFNELFYDEEYVDAATHAAISPKGVLRDMETFLRFKEVSENFEGSPSPLLVFAEAFMYSSSAQNHYADEKISFECVNCALRENRPDLVLHWMSNGYIKSCKSVADRLVEFASSTSKRKTACLAVAQKMYAELEGSKVISAALLYKLKQPTRMLEFAISEKFTRDTYLTLIKECMDVDLVWLLCNTKGDDILEDDTGRNYTGYEGSLPLPLSQALASLLSEGEEAKEMVLNLLDDIFYGQKSGQDENGSEPESAFLTSDLSKIIYEDGQDPYDTDDLVKQRWEALAGACEDSGRTEVLMEILAAFTVRATMKKALDLIAEDEKEQFDYYT